MRRIMLLAAQDKKPSIGGVWSPDSGWANRSSRVQIMEPTYRLRSDDAVSSSELPSDFTPRDELLGEMHALVDGLEGGEVELGCEVLGVEEVSETETVLTYSQDGEHKTRVCTEVIFCTGGLQTRREVTYPGEAEFAGPIVEGNGGGPDTLDLEGKHVLILGMGAFAVENVRTCLLGGAARVTVLTRSVNLVVSRVAIFLGFQASQKLERGMDIAAKQKAAIEAMKKAAAAKAAAASEGEDQQEGAAASRKAPPFDPAALIDAPYKLAGIEHLLPQNNVGGQNNAGGTIPAGNDIFFVGTALGRVETLQGEVERVVEGGVVTTDGEQIDGEIIIKNFGFEPPDAHLANLVGRSNIRSPIWITPRMMLFKAEHNMSLGAETAFFGHHSIFSSKPPIICPDRLGTSLVNAEQAVVSVGTDGPVEQGHAIAIPASVVFMADAYLELYLHFRQRPEALQALLEQGQGHDAAIPDVDIWEDTHASLSKGWWSAMESDPTLEAKMHRLRADFNTRVHGRYTVLEYVEQNKRDWEEACAQLTGDAAAVPYVWEKLLAMLQAKPEALDRLVNRVAVQPQSREQQPVEAAAPAPARTTARL
jgi:cation diffusion facilitator CzcD-associated flavoprotein CzcO